MQGMETSSSDVPLYSPAGPAFYASVFHPDFNLDVEDCSATIDRFEHHVKVFDERIGTLRGVMGGFREARNGFLGVVSEGPKHDHEHETEEKEKEKYLNDEGVWCWRDGCEGVLFAYHKAVQKMAECMQGVANLHEDSAKRTTLAIHDMVKDMSHQPLIDTHKQALARYRDSINRNHAHHDTSSRCETVLHTTLAELETYHTQRAEDLTRVATEYLDEEIALYEQVLARLRAARAGFEQKDAAGRDLFLPTPVPQPTAHVYDPAPVRPVSTAVNMLIDGIGASGDKTGLKFWS
ncbi:WASP-binding domain of Sorting nexin protein [Rhizoctonia solani]|uniref:WASP-binding domain of Sorting nexin protein n=1 Tax=Rhizoctonia solani TaxID=456999 RepID=A0A8H7IKU8_9AGAM|nr:WASP-binding domain of Sorting nexin protein [Rhizoctonia solani]